MPVMQLEIVTASETLNPHSVPAPAEPTTTSPRRRGLRAAPRGASDLAERAAQLARDLDDELPSAHRPPDPDSPDRRRGRSR
jgi:hypothetical protein